MYCTECGAFVPDTCKFCTTCGAPMSTQEAGKQTSGSVASTDQTGTEFQASPSATAPSPTPSAVADNQAPAPNPYAPAPPTFQAPKKNNDKLVIGIIAGVAVLSLVGTLIFLFGGSILGAAIIETADSVDAVLDIDDVDDDAFADYLSRKVDTDGDGYISQKEADRVTSIGNLSQDFTYGNGLCASGVEDLDGIEVFHNLKVLLVCDNELESLDLSQNTKLRFVDCSDNYLEDLELPETEKLTTLWAYDNRLDELDVSGAPELDDLLVDPGVELEGWHGDADECYVYDDDDFGDHYGIYDYDDGDGYLYGDDDYLETSGRLAAPTLA